ncbi:hypothetical protein AYI68_g720 [Smittium mucronatum]|uniref:Uncharacterized protein n=1 Tax=Smittium mucronatum TaxID=133383 RepID=A0A1R0H7A9_9FUNG|nr:hypothetical protein AYI68_g720 [Smittium mucronatum]
MGRSKKRSTEDTDPAKESTLGFKRAKPETDNPELAKSSAPNENDDANGNENDYALGEIEFSPEELEAMTPKEIHLFALEEMRQGTDDSRVVATRLLEEGINKYEKRVGTLDADSGLGKTGVDVALVTEYIEMLLAAAEYIGYAGYAERALAATLALDRSNTELDSAGAADESVPIPRLRLCVYECRARILQQVLDTEFHRDDIEYIDGIGDGDVGEPTEFSLDSDGFATFGDLFASWTDFEFESFGTATFRDTVSTLTRLNNFLLYPERILEKIILNSFDFDNCTLKTSRDKLKSRTKTESEEDVVVAAMKLLAETKLLKISSFVANDDDEVLEDLEEATRILKGAQSIKPSDQTIKDMLLELQ